MAKTTKTLMMNFIFHALLFHLLFLPATRSQQMCFTTNAELREAVLAYYDDDFPNTTVAKKYGYPIGNWCVKNVKDFSNIFDGLKWFNEPLTNWDTKRATSMYAMFRKAAYFNQDVSHFKTSLVDDFSEMFYKASSFNYDISKWDLQSAKLTSYMFRYAKKFRHNLCSWNQYKSHFEDIDYMFSDSNCPFWSSPDLDASAFGPFCYECAEPPQGNCISDTDCLLVVRNRCPTCSLDSTCFTQALSQCCSTQVTNAYAGNVRGKYKKLFCAEPIQPGCFVSNTELREAVLAYYDNPTQNSTVAKTYGYPIGNWCVKHVEDFSNIFEGLKWFNEPLTKWNTTRATSMYAMFRKAEYFNQDVSHFKTGLVDDFKDMFYSAKSFNYDISKWDMRSAKYTSYMFRYAKNFRRNLCSWNKFINGSEYVSHMFSDTNCPSWSSPKLDASPSGPFCFNCVG